MTEHIIELSNRYALKLDGSQNYILYKIEPKESGGYERLGGKICKDLFTVVDALAYCELMGEDVLTLNEVEKVLHGIHAEVKRIAEIQASYAHP